MTTYDTKTVTALPCAQFLDTSASITAVMAICPEATVDPTEQRTMIVPVTHGRKRTVFVGDWVFSAAAGYYTVMSDASFQALFTATP